MNVVVICFVQGKEARVQLVEGVLLQTVIVALEAGLSFFDHVDDLVEVGDLPFVEGVGDLGQEG